MKWSTVLLVGSIGIRALGVHAMPSVEVDMTMSLELQPVRKLQSCQTTKTLPWPSTSAEGRGDVRRLPATPCSLTLAIATEACQVAPPSIERNERMLAPPSYGTITLPFGCTTGCPPRPVSRPPVGVAGPQVRPPSVDVLMNISPPIPKSSHSV